MKKKILIVDDEKDIRDLLEFNLENEGYKTIKARDGLQALQKAASHSPDLILLDIMLPHKDGFEVLRELRAGQTTKEIPVIFLTAKDNEIDEVVGLEMGADDYIVKPISIRKLIAHVKKSLRKKPQLQDDGAQALIFNGLTIDPPSYRVIVDENDVVLTRKEFEILLYLARRPGRVITRRILLDELWDDNVTVIDRTIDVHIRKIREKLGDNHMSKIETIKDVGYRCKCE